jgi:hypothetical protein
MATRANSSAEALRRIEPLKDGETARFLFDVTVWNNSGRYMVRRGVGGVTLCHTPLRAAKRAVALVNQVRRAEAKARDKERSLHG